MSAGGSYRKHLRLVGQRDQHVRLARGGADLRHPRGCSAHDHADAANFWRAVDVARPIPHGRWGASAERGTAEANGEDAGRHSFEYRGTPSRDHSEVSWDTWLVWLAGIPSPAASELCWFTGADRHRSA